MALTKEDITAAIEQTENQDAIRWALSNYFEDLEEPVAVAIGIGDRPAETPFLRESIDKMVNLLRSKGVDAVSFLDPQAARPDKFVVNESGVLCPFMSPADSLKAATLILDTSIKNGYIIVGHVNPQSQENILYVADSYVADKSKIINDGAQGIDLSVSHPDKEKFKEIEVRYGGNYKSFIDRKINEAYTASKVVDFDSIDIKNVYENGIAELYRGGTLGAHPYATISSYNARKVAHSSPAISICAGFSGKDKTCSTRGGAVYKKTQSGISYGFIYKFESMGDEQRFYSNIDLERAYEPRQRDAVDLSSGAPLWGLDGPIYESPILPHHNKLKEMYIYVGKAGTSETKLFSVPLDENGNITDPEWRDFMELHEPSDDKVSGYTKDRQNAQKREQTKDKQHTYSFELKQELEPDYQEYLAKISARDFLRNFTDDAGITQENGILHVDADGRCLYMSNLKLAYFPDLSDVKISGRLELNNFSIAEVDATKLPECTHGVDLNGVDVKNVSALSADKFLGIIGAERTKDGFLECARDDNRLSCDEMPQGWDKLKFIRILGVDLVYDSVEQIPETLDGIYLSSVTIKDQHSIEDMPATDFIYKIKGNLGTHRFIHEVSEIYSQGIRHTEIHDDIELNLENTNISTLPKDMKGMTLGRVILNRNAVVTSLDNFPITKKGILNLNFQGDLKNETMESFLLKTEGKEWVERNTAKAEDGHLIINGDFDFNTVAMGGCDKITSFPKDVGTVEIRGDVKPSYLGRKLKDYCEIMKSKDIDSLIISRDICLNDGTPLDMAHLSVGRLSLDKISADEIIFPKEVKAIGFTETQLNKPITLPKGIQNFDAQSTNFPDGSVLDLSESKKVSLTNCTLPKNSTLDLSKCESVELRNVDLSDVCIIMPKNGRVNISENVKFAPDYKLDLSKSKDGFVHHSVECAEVKLPQAVITNGMDEYIVPKQTKEISTSCIMDSCCHFKIPSHTEIIDEVGENGKKVSLKSLKLYGLSREQAAELRKERVKNMFHLSKNVSKLLHSSAKSVREQVSKINIILTKHGMSKNVEKSNKKIPVPDKEKIAALSGRGGAKPALAISADEKAVIMEQGVQNNNVNAPQVKTEPQISSAEKVADMSEKEKGRFFHKLRMGINLILHKKEQGGLSVQPMSKTQTNIQQPNVAQMKISNDRGSR